MTNNTTPGGVCGGDEYGTNYEAFRAFDNDSSTHFGTVVTNGKVYYQFIKNVGIKKICFTSSIGGTDSGTKNFNVRFVYSDDGYNWTYSDDYNVAQGEEYSISLNCNKHLYWGISINRSMISGSSWNVETLQLYGR